jgi:hypothetical protein
MTLTADSARAAFDHLTRTDPPVHTTVLFDTACVLGGSIAGLVAHGCLPTTPAPSSSSNAMT